MAECVPLNFAPCGQSHWLPCTMSWLACDQVGCSQVPSLQARCLLMHPVSGSAEHGKYRKLSSISPPRSQLQAEAPCTGPLNRGWFVDAPMDHELMGRALYAHCPAQLLPYWLNVSTKPLCQIFGFLEEYKIEGL